MHVSQLSSFVRRRSLVNCQASFEEFAACGGERRGSRGHSPRAPRQRAGALCTPPTSFEEFAACDSPRAPRQRAGALCTPQDSFHLMLDEVQAPLSTARQRVRSASWRYIWLCLSICLLLSSFMLVSCSNGITGGGGSTPTSTGQSTPSQVALAKLHWCNKAFIVFRDEHAPVKVTPTGTPATATATSTAAANSTPTTLTDWSQIKSNLGFTVFLPVT